MIKTIILINDYLREFNIVSTILRLFLATFLSGIVGWERSKSGRAAGLRTHILVCLGATIASMTGLYITEMAGTGDTTRIAAQVVSGIGFLGAGTILVRNNISVKGLTTSACVWAVGTIGIAVGYGFYEAAVFGTVLIYFVTKKLGIVDKKLHTKELPIYIEFVNAKHIHKTINLIKDCGVDIGNVHLVKTKANLQNGIGSEILLQLEKDCNAEEILDKINTLENVHFAISII